MENPMRPPADTVNDDDSQMDVDPPTSLPGDAMAQGDTSSSTAHAAPDSSSSNPPTDPASGSTEEPTDTAMNQLVILFDIFQSSDDETARLDAADKLLELLRDFHSVEQLSRFDTVAFAVKLLPAILPTLSMDPPMPMSPISGQKLRSSALQLLQYAIAPQVVKDHVGQLLPALYAIIELDVEEVSLIASKCLVALQRVKLIPKELAIPGLTGVLYRMIKALPEAIVSTFNDALRSLETSGEGTADACDVPFEPTPLTPRRTLPSIKVIGDCSPVLFHHLHEELDPAHRDHISQLINAVIAVTMALPRQQQQYLELADQEGRMHVGIAPALVRVTDLYFELLSWQVKMVGLLSFIMPPTIQAPSVDQLRQIADMTIQLARCLPGEPYLTRRELLQAFRNFIAPTTNKPLNSHYRVGMLQFLPRLLPEQIWLGDGATTRSMLCALVIRVMAEWIETERNALDRALSLDDFALIHQHFSALIQDMRLDPTATHNALRATNALQDALVQMFHRLMEKKNEHGKYMSNMQGWVQTNNSQMQVQGVPQPLSPEEVGRLDRLVPLTETLMRQSLAVITAFLVGIADRIPEFRVLKKSILSPAMRATPTTASVDSTSGSGSPAQHDSDTMQLGEPPLSSLSTDPTLASGHSATATTTATGHANSAAGSPMLPSAMDEIDFVLSRPLRSHFSTTSPTARIGVTPSREEILSREKQTLQSLLGIFLPRLTWIVEQLRGCISARGIKPDTTVALYSPESPAERQLFLALFGAVLQCFELFWMDIPHANMAAQSSDPMFSHMGSKVKEERKMADEFLGMFLHLDPALYQEVLESNVDGMLHGILNDTALLALPQSLLAHEQLASGCLSVILPMILDKLPGIDEGNPYLCAIFVRLLKLVISTVRNQPALCQSIYFKYYVPLIEKCLELSSKTLNPTPYFLVLHQLVRSQSSEVEAEHELLRPRLHVLLAELVRRIRESPHVHVRETILEIILGLPMTLEDALPYLELLLPPLIMALHMSPKLVNGALRIIDRVLDGLSRSFVEQSVKNVSAGLLRGLSLHLHPLPYNKEDANIAFRILGRLGGFNHSHLEWAPESATKLNPAPAKVPIKFALLAGTGQMAGASLDVAELTAHCIEIFNSDDPKFEALWPEAYQFLRYVAEESKMLVDPALFTALMHAARLDVADSAVYVKLLVQRGLASAHANVLLDGLVPMFVHHLPQSRDLARSLLMHAFIVGLGQQRQQDGADAATLAPVFHAAALKLCRLCYCDGFWQLSGGLDGIAACVQLKVSVQWLVEREIDFIQALMYLLKAVPNAPFAARIQDLLNQLVKQCNQPSIDPVSKDHAQSVTALFASDLASDSAQARAAAKACIRLLADLLGTDVTDLLRPMRDQLVDPIINKPFRTLPEAMQIGHMDALTYCLNLRPPLLELSDGLDKLLIEARAMVGAEDKDNGSAHEWAVEGSVGVARRVACVQLLSAAMSCEGFVEPNDCNKIQLAFFRSFTSQPKPVVDAAEEAMRQIVSPANRPLNFSKSVLEQQLKPILAALTDRTKFTLQNVETLGRLGNLMPGCFRVEVWNRLLVELKDVADDPATLMAAKQNFTLSRECTLLVAGLMSLGTLPAEFDLPIEGPIQFVLHLEELTRRQLTSPFRDPLAVFCSRTPDLAIKWFASHVSTTPAVLSLFIGLLKSPKGQPLRQALQMGLDTFFGGDDDSSTLSLAQCVIVATLVSLKCNVLTDSLYQRLPEPSAVASAHEYDEQSVQLVELYLMFAARPTTRVPAYRALSKWLAAFPMSFMRVRIEARMHAAAFAYGWNDVDAIMEQCLGTLEPNDDMVLSHLLVPACQFVFILFRSQQQQQQLSESQRPSSALSITHASSSSQPSSQQVPPQNPLQVVLTPNRLEQIRAIPLSTLPDKLVLEIFQLLTCLVQYIPGQLMTVWDDVLRLAYGFVENRDTTIRGSALGVLAATIATFEHVPARFIGQTFEALAREGAMEVRPLMYQALEVLLDLLPSRLEGFPQSMVTAIQAALSDEKVFNQAHPLHIVTAGRAIFYHVRSALMPSLLASAQRLISPPTQMDGRVVALELMETIVEWAEQSAQEAAAAAAQAASDEDAMQIGDEVVTSSSLAPASATAPTAGAAATTTANADLFADEAFRRQLTDATVRLFFSMEPYVALVNNRYEGSAMPLAGEPGDVHLKARDEGRGGGGDDAKAGTTATTLTAAAPLLASARVIVIFRRLYKLWPNIVLRHHVLEREITRTFTSSERDRLVLFLRTLDVLAVDLEHPRDIMHVSKTYKMASQIISIGNMRTPLFASALVPFFARLLMQESIEFQVLQSITLLITTSLKQLELQSLVMAVQFATAFAKRDPAAVESFVTPVLQSFVALNAHVVGMEDVTPEWEADFMAIFALLNVRFGLLVDDQRRVYLGVLHKIAEEAKSPRLCRLLLTVCRGWVQDRSNTPSLREKSALIASLHAVQRFDDKDLMHEYFELVVKVLRERSELSRGLEGAFLQGMRSPHLPTRKLLLGLVDDVLPRDIASRLEYALVVQNWEPLSTAYYIPQFLDLLWSSIEAAPQLSGIVSSLIHVRPESAHALWIQLFPTAWGILTVRERDVVLPAMLALLTRDYHHQQQHLQPNVISTFLEGINRCNPLPRFPPHVIRYLGRTFNACNRDQERTVLDAFGDLLKELNDVDMFMGLWRRRCMYPETNTALSCQQVGLYERAQQIYEHAQFKARSNAMSFNEAEFTLWEEQWVQCSEKLQHWDVLQDVGSADGRKDLIVEAMWRLNDWIVGDGTHKIEALTQGMSESPRTKVLQAIMSLNRIYERKALDEPARTAEFLSICEEGVQLALKQWHQLPRAVSDSHIPLLAHFQQFVELSETLTIFQSLAKTNVDTYQEEAKCQKTTLNNWRERLPNVWDDMNLWSDLVAWRQIVFGAINRTYYPIAAGAPSAGNGAATGGGAAAAAAAAAAANGGGGGSFNNAAAFRGYHETAWIINRFSNAARHHGLKSVCATYLPKIYTLPNIEIQEAFLKIRESVKCNLTDPNEYEEGLNTLRSTNLSFFSDSQKAEFNVLQAQFYSMLKNDVLALGAFHEGAGQDPKLPKVWASWGQWYEQRIPLDTSSSAMDVDDKHNPAGDALMCYLAVISKSKDVKRSRRFVAKVLWLLVNQDRTKQQTLSTQFTEYRDAWMPWKWVSFIPQLLNMLVASHTREPAKVILNQIAQHYPQALHLHLRTFRDEVYAQDNGSAAQLLKHDLDEVHMALKSSTPLLVLSMEMMVQTLVDRVKPTPQEDMYRLLVANLNGMIEDVCASLAVPRVDGQPPAPPVGVARMANFTSLMSQSPALSPFMERFQQDVAPPADPLVRIDRMRIWRDELQREIDSYRSQDHLPRLLIEFDHHRFDTVDIPGQSLQLVDSPHMFLKITRFRPEIRRMRRDGDTRRGIEIVANDGTAHSFLIQQPAPRQCRREERVIQLFNYFNGLLDASVESRKRGLQFQFPTVVPLAGHARMIAHDPTGVSLEQIWAAHCKKLEVPSDHVVMYYLSQLQERGLTDTAGKMAILESIGRQFAPVDLVERYIAEHLTAQSDVWMMRKHVCKQMAVLSFLSYTMAIAARLPQSIHLSLGTGHMWMSEALPSMDNVVIQTQEPVPFRLTPALQHFMTLNGIDGPFSACVLAIAKALTVDIVGPKPATVVEDYLRVIVRDDVLSWSAQAGMALDDAAVATKVQENCRAVIGRMHKLVENYVAASDPAADPDKVEPVNKPLLELVSRATNPHNLAEMSVLWMPFL
ncbi:FAT domain-containing protein [Blastocladiella britannica]|nr:FAT domain-containing protein [Blastocladiella britannica]